MSISAPLFAAAAAAAAAAIVLLTIARRSTPSCRPNRHVVLDEEADTASSADPDSIPGYQTQESRHAQIRHMLGEPDAHDQRVSSGPSDHLIEARQRWMTDGGTSVDDRRWTL